MKRKSIINLAALLICATNTAFAQQVVLYRADGTQVKLHVSEFDSISFHTDDWVDPTGEPNRIPMSFTATFEGNENSDDARKIHMGDGGTGVRTMLWSAGDAVSVLFNASTSKPNEKFTLSSGDGTSQGTFKGTGLSGYNQNIHNVIYPYQADLTVDNSTGVVSNLVVPAIQYVKDYFGTAGSCDPHAAVMMTKVENLQASSTQQTTSIAYFKNVCSYLAVTIPEGVSNIQRIDVASLGDEKITGMASVKLDNGIPVVQSSTGYSQVSLVGSLAAGQTYYIAVLPGTLSSGFRVISYTGDKYISKKVSSSVALNRSQYLDCTGMVEQPTKDYCVDLGLSVKWATRNVGALQPQDRGYYFEWGETAPLYGYSSATLYKTEISANAVSTFHDAATTNWGTGWRMPTKDEFQALINLPKEYTSNYKSTGQKGYIFYHISHTSVTNDGTVDTNEGTDVTHIFLPSVGYSGDGYQNDNGYYWTSTGTDAHNAQCMEISGSTTHTIASVAKTTLRSIRPVIGN